MTLHALIEYAKTVTHEVAFHAAPNQGVKTDVTFLVLDAEFGFIGYGDLSAGYITVDQLNDMSQTGRPLEVTFKDDVDQERYRTHAAGEEDSDA